ncbi:unnamed protein product [Ranitomeya imitator]|uniref:Reverse transcriptase domain-containing protein n=1 Tax=Ranitomeya imitator TaxID=111125 RepID=A0ABN9KNF5_9NEOB|nr:unnamed protein product [Ranitomeya imitator]
MVTADVEALYTSIRHADGIEAVALYLRTSNLDGNLVELLLELLEFVLLHNVFVFGQGTYLQLHGTAMGACCAPSYANLFLGAWEREIFMSNPIPQTDLIQGWMRYINDVWFVWEGSIKDLHVLMAALNRNDLNIKLTFKYGRSVDFLDLQIRALPKGDLVTSVFRKPTATNSLLHAESAHLPSTIKGIPVGQFLRVRRICSKDDDFYMQANDLTERILQRGYSQKVIRKGRVRAERTSRNTLLYNNATRLNKDKDQVRLITGYHNKWFQFKNIIEKHWAVLQTDPILKQCLPSRPSIVAKRSRNIRDILVHSHYEPSKKNKGAKQDLIGFFPCGR